MERCDLTRTFSFHSEKFRRLHVDGILAGHIDRDHLVHLPIQIIPQPIVPGNPPTTASCGGVRGGIPRGVGGADGVSLHVSQLPLDDVGREAVLVQERAGLLRNPCGVISPFAQPIVRGPTRIVFSLMGRPSLRAEGEKPRSPTREGTQLPEELQGLLGQGHVLTSRITVFVLLRLLYGFVLT